MTETTRFRATRRHVLTSALGAAAATVLPRGGFAQTFPTRTVRVVVPFPAGGTTDLLARIFCQRLSESLGQTFVVENAGGAGGSLGAEQIARAAPDGYALLFHNLTFSTTTASLQYAGRSRHDLDDFAAVSLAANVPMLLVAHPSVPARDLKEFIGYAKEQTAKKQSLFYGSTGPGSVMNFAGEVMKRDAGIAMDHVPFRGAAPLIQEVISGRIQFGGDQLSTSLQHVRSGSLKAMATLSASRIPELPDTPTVREAGLPNMEMRGWNGFFAPAKTPQPVIERLRAEIAAAAAHPDVRRRLAEVGAEPASSSPDELKAIVRAQMDHVKPLVAELKLVVQ